LKSDEDASATGALAIKFEQDDPATIPDGGLLEHRVSLTAVDEMRYRPRRPQTVGQDGISVSKKSKQVENRIRTSEHVMTAAKTHRDQIADVLAQRAKKSQGPNTVITKETFQAVIDYLVDDLKHAVTSMDDAEARVVAERADDVGLREKRDTAAANLQAAVVRVRSMVLDALGEKKLATYGLSGDTPRITRDLVTHAVTVGKLMQEEPFHVAVDGVTFDSAAMAATLTSKANAVEQTLDDMLREEQELVNELGFRHTAITEWTDAHQGIADALTGLFRLAGRKDLAERVRPTSRSLAGEETPEDTTTAGNESAGKSEV
jgi:hypothetical protein